MDTSKVMPESVRAHVVGADMGYGHQRAIHPLRFLSSEGAVPAGSNRWISAHERKQWLRYLRMYETLSRAKAIPLVGNYIFGMLDSLMHIPALYPLRNLSRSTVGVELLYSQIRKGLASGVVKAMEQEHIPLVTSFYAPAIAADMHGFDQVYCVICDADINRVWVAKEPWESRIKYFAPCGKVALRLQSYGVSADHIYTTGFPLDDSLTGGRDLSILKQDLLARLSTLDPSGRFHTAHGASVRHFFGDTVQRDVVRRPLSITFAVGGAGAQTEIGSTLMQSLKQLILDGKVKLNLVAGTRADVRDYFIDHRRKTFGDDTAVEIVYSDVQETYFEKFNSTIRTTDVLWTKPSELVFYTGLGLPIIMAPPIGSQEKFNRKWLLEVGAGMRQEKPHAAHDWLPELLKNGRFADMAWMGFLRARKLGTHNIVDVLKNGNFKVSDHPLER